MINFIQSHRTIAQIMDRIGLRNWVSRRVWAELDALPGFHEELIQSQREFAEGRTYRVSAWP